MGRRPAVGAASASSLYTGGVINHAMKDSTGSGVIPEIFPKTDSASVPVSTPSSMDTWLDSATGKKNDYLHIPISATFTPGGTN